MAVWLTGKEKVKPSGISLSVGMLFSVMKVRTESARKSKRTSD